MEYSSLSFVCSIDQINLEHISCRSYPVAMLHFRDVMLKAQAEIDAVVGHDRMPGFEDRDRLPYVRGLINEILRWRPSTALSGVPHAVTADNVYNGM